VNGVRGAIAAEAGALLAVAAVRSLAAGPIAGVLGPAPLPSVLAAASLALALVAGAIVERRAARLGGSAGRRVALIAVWVVVAYLGVLTLAVAGILVASRGAEELLFPFLLVGNSLAVALALLPWTAVPIAVAAFAIEGWTRTGPGRARALRTATAVVAAAVVAGAALLLI
jgi:hypothetical protein